jgi:metal-responsive CopG/Arc/MetJ family transcriptional regulator
MAKKGRPPVDSIGVMVRIRDDLIEKIDDHRRNEADLPSRPEMIRRIISDWIENKEKK